MSRLPPAFAELEPFCDYWVCESGNERIDRREQASMAEIKRFYDAAKRRVDEALRYLDGYELGREPPDARTLMRLMLALAHASVSVESIGAPRGEFSPRTRVLTITRDFRTI